jgi:hypothetical protein
VAPNFKKLAVLVLISFALVGTARVQDAEPALTKDHPILDLDLRQIASVVNFRKDGGVDFDGALRR